MAGVPIASAMKEELEAMIRTDHSVEVLSYIIPVDLFPNGRTRSVWCNLKLCAQLPPQVPPRSMRDRVASSEEIVFLWSGARDVLIVMALYEDLDADPSAS